MAANRQSFLDELCHRLRARAARNRWAGYRVPALWNCWGYADARRLGRSEIAVDPYAFLFAVLEQEVLPARGGRRLAGRSLSQDDSGQGASGRPARSTGRRRRGGEWLRMASFYGMLVRTTTAWDHDGDGDLSSVRCTETGTFLKSILLLPLLRRMGITALYLLPVTKHSNLFRKGEMGCPYAAKSFFELEPSLHDRLLGDDPGDVELEFGAFVEAAHAMGMRVLLDLAPRSTARDADWILDHPDWFYWIDRKAERTYGSPRIEGADYSIPRPSDLREIHSRSVMRAHLAKFRFAPHVTAPARWRAFVRRMRRDPPRNLLVEITREFGVITPPGFSDCVNDNQPPWSDVTFLRYFWDHPASVVPCLPAPDRQPPYIFSEVIKSSVHPGKQPNVELWNKLASILPFYQGFGIDGARIDMGHALPAGLERMILEAPRRIDPDFGFIAEEFGTGHSAKLRRAGYNLLIGPCWGMQPRAAEGLFHKLVHEVLPKSKLPVWATPEIPDSPRAVVRDGGRVFARLAAVVNQFLPNAAPFVNSGMEVGERQPMNLGLDVAPPGRFALRRKDSYSGKLAFFDRYVLHWGNAGRDGLVDLVAAAGTVRRRFLDEVANPSNYFAPTVLRDARVILAVGFRVNGWRQTLLILANTDYRRSKRACVAGCAPWAGESRARCPRLQPEVLLEVAPGGARPRLSGDTVSMSLPPGGVRVLLL